MTNRKSGENSTFWLISLDPEDRLRYPPVSLFIAMCLWSGVARLVWENLFDVRNFEVKVGCLAQNSHGSQIVKWRKFDPTCRFPRATPIFPALPGAARWRSLPLYVRHVACRDGSVSSNIILHPGRRSRQCDEQKIQENCHVLVDISGS